MANAKGQKQIKRAHERGLQRALKEERLGLAAIAKVFVQEANDPGRLLARLEVMTRKAATDPRTSAGLRQALLDGTRILRTAIEREMGKPQSLLDPHLGHVSTAAVDKIVEQPVEEQLGLTNGAASDMDTASSVHNERLRVQRDSQRALVDILQQGPATDEELIRRYRLLTTAPVQSEAALKDRRKELTRSGRVCESGSRHRGEILWQLVEEQLLRT